MATPGIPTPFPSPFTINDFETTLAATVGANVGDVCTLTTVLNADGVTIPVSGYAVISLSDTTGLKEYIRYSGLNVGAETVVLAARGLGNTTAQAHAGGSTFSIVVGADYFNDLTIDLQDVTSGHNHDGSNSRTVSLVSPGPIGSVTPNTGAFTTLTATSIIPLTSTLKTMAVKAKTTDETVVSSISPQDDDTLFFSVTSGETWTADIFADFTTPIAAGFRFEVTSPTFSVGIYNSVLCSNVLAPFVSNTNALNTGTSYGGGTTNTANALHVKLVGTFTASGIVRFRWAQDTSDPGSTTVRAGSHLVAYRTN